MMPEIFFWTSLAILFYCYTGYGILLFLLNGIRSFLSRNRAVPAATDHLPVTIIITAYNEKAVLDQKVRNTLAIDYPRDKLTILFVTDGSEDAPGTVLQHYPFIIHLHQPERRGKYAAIKRAMRQVKTPIVVFSDANSMLNPGCLKKIVSHFTDPRTGGVAGEKKINQGPGTSVLGKAEGLYWQYESLMKRLDARFYSVVGAAGELFSIRTELFRPLDDQVILDDFITSMFVCLQGYRIAYEPGAYATEHASASLAEEQKRKIRISAGAYQSVGYLKKCLNLFRHPLTGFQYISRRLLRWVVCPLLLPVLFISNGWLLTRAPGFPFYLVFFAGQTGFYLLALTGWLKMRAGKTAGLFTIPFYFVFMNYCLARGFLLFAANKHTVLWEKSLRHASGQS